MYQLKQLPEDFRVEEKISMSFAQQGPYAIFLLEKKTKHPLCKISKYSYCHRVFRKFKFILVGCSSLMIQLTFFNLFLLAYKLKPTPATLLSDGFAILTSFFLNNAITFRDRRIRIRSETLKLVKSFLKYNYVVLVATLIQTGTVYFGTKIMGDSYLAAHFLFFLGILIGMVWNYKLHNAHVWPQKTATAASAQTYEK